MRILLIFCILLILSRCELMAEFSNPKSSSIDGLGVSVDSYRALIIQKNMKMIREHNANPHATYKMAPYAMFIGYTDEENQAKYFMKNLEEAFKIVEVEGHAAKIIESSKLKGPLSVDLTSRYGTPVLNQGACGNCYAYSTTDTVNMINKYYGKGYPLLSAQHLTDCSYYVQLIGSFNQGCMGGNLFTSMQYQRLYGVYPLSVYPINGQTVSNGIQQPCRYANSPKFYIRNWYYFTTSSCFTRMSYIQSGMAISVGVAGGNPSFWYYRSGILYDCVSNRIDHAVVMVGFYYDYISLYTSYIILKNSWGISWGENGKIRISLAGTSCMACVYGTFSS